MHRTVGSLLCPWTDSFKHMCLEEQQMPQLAPGLQGSPWLQSSSGTSMQSVRLWSRLAHWPPSSPVLGLQDDQPLLSITQILLHPWL